MWRPGPGIFLSFSERSETLRKIETSHAPSFRSGQKHSEPSISADEVIDRGKKLSRRKEFFWRIFMYRKESVAYSREVDLSVNAQNLTRNTDTFILIISGHHTPTAPRNCRFMCVMFGARRSRGAGRVVELLFRLLFT